MYLKAYFAIAGYSKDTLIDDHHYSLYHIMSYHIVSY